MTNEEAKICIVKILTAIYATDEMDEKFISLACEYIYSLAIAQGRNQALEDLRKEVRIND